MLAQTKQLKIFPLFKIIKVGEEPLKSRYDDDDLGQNRRCHRNIEDH